jgi:outer membrane protein OmpA-like peptidoglycan-associated protein
VQSPELAALPDPEPPRTAPPPPSLVAAPTTAAIAPIQPPAAVVAAGTPQPAPPPAPVAMTPPPPPPPTPGKAPQRRPPPGATLATLDVAGEPDARNRELIERIAGLYKQKSDTIRVVGYAGAPAPGADPLDNYRAALDRAQSVAKLLGDAGMPANRIQTEATPAGSPDSTGGRVEIQLLP